MRTSLRKTGVLTLAALALAATSAAPAAAQGTEISVAVLPFGTLEANESRTPAALRLAQQAVGAIDASGLYTVIDRSTDAAIEEELNKAEGLRNFESRVQLTTTARLNAAVLLIGLVEKAALEMKQPTEPGGQPTYAAELGVRIKLVRTQTGELIKGQYFTVRNQSSASKAVEGNRFTRRLPKGLQKAIGEQVDDKLREKVSKETDIKMGDRTQEDAIRSAAEQLKPELEKFLQDSYGAVVAASRRK